VYEFGSPTCFIRIGSYAICVQADLKVRLYALSAANRSVVSDGAADRCVVNHGAANRYVVNHGS
jgi:hypothetical protein